MKILLKGGQVVSGQGLRRADVLLDGETVAAVVEYRDGSVVDVLREIESR